MSFNLEELEKSTNIFLKAIGEDIKREGLIETPKRVAKSWAELLNGYNQNDKQFYKTFNCDNSNLIIIKNIEFTSFCEHHILPFQGLITIGYEPNGKVLGLSKFGRIVDCFAKRLQLQEKLVNDIGKSILENLKPKSLFVISKATHSCMACRGIKKQKSNTLTFFTYGKKYNELDLIKLID